MDLETCGVRGGSEGASWAGVLTLARGLAGIAAVARKRGWAPVIVFKGRRFCARGVFCSGVSASGRRVVFGGGGAIHGCIVHHIEFIGLSRRSADTKRRWLWFRPRALITKGSGAAFYRS